MLRIEKGGEGQIPDELAAYEPLVPQGKELGTLNLFAGMADLNQCSLHTNVRDRG